jgi:hypothetical protein
MGRPCSLHHDHGEATMTDTELEKTQTQSTFENLRFQDAGPLRKRVGWGGARAGAGRKPASAVEREEQAQLKIETKIRREQAKVRLRQIVNTMRAEERWSELTEAELSVLGLSMLGAMLIPQSKMLAALMEHIYADALGIDDDVEATIYDTASEFLRGSNS